MTLNNSYVFLHHKRHCKASKFNQLTSFEPRKVPRIRVLYVIKYNELQLIKNEGIACTEAELSDVVDAQRKQQESENMQHGPRAPEQRAAAQHAPHHCSHLHDLKQLVWCV